MKRYSPIVAIAAAVLSGALALAGCTNTTGTSTSDSSSSSTTSSTDSTTTTTKETAAKPTFSESGRAYCGLQFLTLSTTTSGATIYYTTDGTTPTSSSSAYSSPLYITASETVKAIAIASGYTNSDVASADYAINYYSRGQNAYKMPCYFKNGTEVLLTMPSGYAGGGKATCDAVWIINYSNGTPVYGGYVYATSNATSYSYQPCYWTDTTPTLCPVPSDATGGQIQGITINGSDVIAVGYIYKNTYQYPCYWLNGAYKSLSSGIGTASTVSVISGSTYIAGNTKTSTDWGVPCYWKDGAITILPYTSGTWAEMNGIYTDGTDLYFIGGLWTSSSDTPCIWKNGSLITLDFTSSSTCSQAQASGMLVYGGSVYVGGSLHNSSWSTMTPCYWKDGSYVSLSLPDGATSGCVWWFSNDGTNTYARGSYWTATSSQECYWSLDGTRHDTAYYTSYSSGGGNLSLTVQ